MPDPLRAIRKAQTQAVVALRERDRLIREARKEGATLREIASAADLSHTAIAKICERT